jgi:hypothetical protein
MKTWYQTIIFTVALMGVMLFGLAIEKAVM